MELLHRNLSRFAVFTVESESEALAMIARATAAMYESPPAFQGFSEEGLLVGVESTDAGDKPLFSGRQEGDVYEDETIQLARFEGGVNLLTIELYDESTDPNQPLNSDNIVLAKQLERLISAAG